MSHNVPFKSETKVVNLGTTLDIFDFVPLRGPGGGRVVVDKWICVVTGTVTVATTLFDGRDVPRVFGLISLEQRDGKLRWNLSGAKSRAASIFYNGIEEHHEHANVAIGATQAIDLRLVIPMAKKKLVREKDFSMPADIFKKFTFSFNSLAAWATSTTVLSAPTLSCYVLAEYHEEHSVEYKAEDVVKSVDFNSTTQGKLALNGAVHDLFLMRDDNSVAGGGNVITALTDVRLEDLGTGVLTRQDVVHSYRVKRQVTASAFGATPGAERYLDPVAEGKVLPILVADYDTSLWDGKVIDSMKIDVGTGVAGLSAISREVTEKSQANFNATTARFNVDTRLLRMKTESKSRRGLNDGWTKREQMVAVWSAPLPKAA